MLVSLLPSDYPACTSLLDLNRPHQNSWFPCLSPMVNTLKDGSCCCWPRTGWVSGLMRFTHVRHPLHIQCWPPWAIPALTTSSPIPWWSTHWESACQCKGHEFNPWSGKFHMPGLSPMCHNYWASVLEHMGHNYWVPVLQLRKPMRLQPVFCNKRNTAISLCTATKSSF